LARFLFVTPVRYVRGDVLSNGRFTSITILRIQTRAALVCEIEIWKSA